MILRQNGVKVECLIAGNGPMEKELKKLVGRMNLEGCVRFLGRLPHERLQALYETRSIDIVALPSIITRSGEKEGIPVALMEAMSYGIPTISTNTGGIQELLGGGCGIMVEEKNPLAIANAIAQLANNKIFYESIADKGKEKVQQEFNLSIISKKLLQLFGT
ncbi:MAG: glycosyltransferase [Sedimentisphaerales bacterium]